MKKPVKYALFLGTLGLIVGLLLALVNMVTKPYIKANEDNKVKDALNSYIQSDNWQEVKSDEAIIYKLNQDNKTIYAIKTSGKGYNSGEIVIMTFISDNKIDKINLVSMNGQTSGIGTQISKEEYLDSFIGKSIDVYANDNALDHKKGDVDVISGATYSSRGLLDALIKACNSYKKVLGE